MKKLLTLLLLLPFIGFAQNTYVPDDNFEQALINLGYDNVLDDYVLTANINTITSLTLDSMGSGSGSWITSLVGIEDFTALTWLDCSFQHLTTLDLSANAALNSLSCRSNFLTSLDVSNSPALTWLDCSENQFVNLDLSNNTSLSQLNINFCFSLKSLNLKNGNNQNMSNVNAVNCDSLECVNVDDVAYALSSSTFTTVTFNTMAYFSENCFLGSFNGTVYYDADSSTTYNSGDYALSNQVLELTSGSGVTQYLTTSNSGQFSSAVDSLESYVLSYYPPNNLTETSNTVSYSFNNIAIDSVLNDLSFGVIGDDNYVDLGIYLTKSFTLCNDTAVLTIDVVNHANTTVDGSFEVWLDGQTPVLTASGSPIITNNHLLWNFTALQPFQSIQQTINYIVPATPATVLTDSALVSPTLLSGAIEINTFNNTAESQEIVFCSWDPNDKKATPEQCYYTASDIMEYTIRFQNTGNYPAQKVRIVDTLDYAVLDVLSFKIIGSSHAYNWEFKGSSILEITFDNIQLVDSSVSYVESQGFFKYQIRFKDNITPLSESEMSAYIYFDNYQPVITNKPLAVYSSNFSTSIALTPYNLEAQVIGGASPFTYLWNTNETTQNITIQNPGNYWAIVTDANGCEFETLYYTVTSVGINEIAGDKSLLRVVDVLGKVVAPKKAIKNTTLFYIYDDGTVEKRITVE